MAYGPTTKRQAFVARPGYPERKMLWSEGLVPVNPAAFTEAVAHHALGKQEKSDCQNDKKREPCQFQTRMTVASQGLSCSN